MKIIKFKEEARHAILVGVQKLNDAVSSTLGPCGKNVVIDRGNGFSTITKDGVSVAREIILEDEFENMGAGMVKQVAGKTNDVAGDGTTTATILATAVYTNGIKHITSGVDPQSIKRGIDKAVDFVVDSIKTQSKVIEGDSGIRDVATISANGDTSIGDIIVQAFKAVGVDGVVKVETSNTTDTSLQVVNGMQFERGYTSPYFATNPDTLECSLDNCFILLHDEKISNINDITPILGQVIQSKKPLLIISDDFEADILSTLVVNNLRGTLKVCAIKSPGYGVTRKQFMEDIAVLTGATVITNDVGIKLENATMAHLGKAKNVIVKNDATTIIIDTSAKIESSERFVERVSLIRNQIETSGNPHETNLLKTRLAKLVSGIAIIKVGARTEAEMFEKKDRVDDAFNATKSAIEEGVVTGGGICLLNASVDITNYIKEHGACETEHQKDELIGWEIVAKALEAPVHKLLTNAGENSEYIVEKLKEFIRMGKRTYGYNVLLGCFDDLFASGVLDPAKVTRSAVQNACSISGLLLTTECMIANKYEPTQAQPQQPQNGMAPAY